MKKSQLRKIIREATRRILNEAPGCSPGDCPTGMYCSFSGGNLQPNGKGTCIEGTPPSTPWGGKTTGGGGKRPSQRETTKVLNEIEPCPGRDNGNIGDSCTILSCCVNGEFIYCPGTWDCKGCTRNPGQMCWTGVDRGSSDIPTTHFKDLNAFEPGGNGEWTRDKDMGNIQNIREGEECCEAHVENTVCFVRLGGRDRCAGTWDCGCNKCICKPGSHALGRGLPEGTNIKLETKTQLRNLIRESIKELVKEQNWTQDMWSTGNYHDYLNWYEGFYTQTVGRNNPCNFLQNQINNWNNNIINTNPNSPTSAAWVGQMNSKISSAKEICCDLGCPCC
jgi:hypothetical protein